MKLREALKAQIGKEKVTFLTLTMRHSKEKLTDLLDNLYRYFRALRVHPVFAERVRGGAAFLEVVRGEKNTGWHPHLHVIMHADFIPFAELQAAWRSITKGSFYLKIEVARSAESVGGYVTKYVTKSLDSSFASNPAWLDEAICGMKGRRLCLCFGTWYGTPLDAAEGTELADDIVDAGGWHYYARVNDILDRAWRGDADAWRMIAECNLREHALVTLATDTS